MATSSCTRWLAVALVAAACGCSGGGSSGPSTPAVATVEVTPATVQLSVGETRQLAATPKSATGVTIGGLSAAWTSANTAVAEVDAAGVVRAIASGTATVSATIGGKSGSAAITVASVPVASVSIVPATAQVAVLGTVTLQATARDALGNALAGRVCSWTSNNSVVATVGSTGTVTGLSTGVATMTATCEGVAATAVVTVIPNTAVTFAVGGRVVEAPANTAVPGARVTATDASALVLAMATTDAAGNWSMPSLALGTSVTLAVSATNYVATTVASFTVSAALTVETVPLVRVNASTGAIGGRALDASTNQPIPTGMAAELREGMGATTGLAVQATTTGADGSYSFTGVTAGTYTLTMRGAGYAQSARTVAVVGGTTTASQDLTLSANAGANQWRVVLSWTASGRDLDLYLTLPGAGSARQQVYFLQPGNCAAAPFACLDRDASTAPGPETITISQLGTGTYRFYVQNYNAPSAASDSTLMLSGAQVRVFRGTQQVATYPVPQQGGTLWTVFELDAASGTLTPRNTMGAGGPGDPAARLVAQLVASPARAGRSGKRDSGLRLP